MIADWTRGAPRLTYEYCPACGAAQAFPRGFCARCGSTQVETREASGLGTVASATEVTRAPSKQLQAYAPYTLLLVDLDEGCRVMAHGDKGLAIGARVKAGFSDFGGGLAPVFAAV